MEIIMNLLKIISLVVTGIMFFGSIWGNIISEGEDKKMYLVIAVLMMVPFGYILVN